MDLLLVKPKIKSISIDEAKFVEKFEISPLEPGQALVFGHSLRTTLLSNIPGYAITNFTFGHRSSEKEDFKMEAHVYTTIPGVRPDLTDISLQLKKANIRLKGNNVKEISIQKKGPCVVTLADFESEDMDILNPELELFKIVDTTEVIMSIKVQEGRGFKREDFFDEDGLLSIDGDFSPVTKVGIDIKNVRVNGESGYEGLEIQISTNGKLLPKETLDIAIRILQEGFSVLRDGVVDVIENEAIYFDVQEEDNKTVVYRNIDELGLSVRAFNALKAYGINNTGDFERYTEKQIKGIDNLGKKTFEEIKKKLTELGVDFKRA